MDVWGVFTGDSQLSTCGLLRSVYYRDYEQFPYGTLESYNSGNSRLTGSGAGSMPKDPYSKVQEKYRNGGNTAKTRKQDCPFCKSNKRRPLINYLRKRDFHKYHDSINEDDECENANEEEKNESNATTTHSSDNPQKNSQKSATATSGSGSQNQKS